MISGYGWNSRYPGSSSSRFSNWKPRLAQFPNDTPWEAVVGAGPTGALLIRPDGNVGARRASLPKDVDRELQAALTAILDLTPKNAATDRSSDKRSCDLD